MMYVSGLLQRAAAQRCSQQVLDAAEDHLFQGQCNCSYWHGAFGGIYLPHLRNAVYQHLLTAESLLERSMGREETWVEATADDYDFDGCAEVRLANDQLVSWIAPNDGGQIYGLDVRGVNHNLGATIQRRPELYHAKVLEGENQNENEAASIHDLVVFKQANLDEKLQYDLQPRNSLIDHFWDDDVDVVSLQESRAVERGDFAMGAYTATIRRNSDRIQILTSREGNAWGIPLTLKKGITLNAGVNALEIAYFIEGLPQNRELHFGVEWNFAGLPDAQHDRFFSDSNGQKMGDLGSILSLEDSRGIKLTDQWLGLQIGLESDQAGGIFAYPVRTVSQSESGFELVHQSVCVQPHWKIKGDVNGCWACRINLKLNAGVTAANQNNSPATVKL